MIWVNRYVTLHSNALLYGLPKKLISKLQPIQNAAVRVLTKTRKSTHVTPILLSLHWLPVSQIIYLKIILLVFKSLNVLPPVFKSSMLFRYEPTRSMRYSGTGLLVIPKARTKP